MFNSEIEKNFLEQKGFVGEIINHNCWLDENTIKPQQVEKIYDAILISRTCSFKRHFLANGVNKLALVTGGQNHEEDLTYPLPDHVYNNSEPISSYEICTKISQSRCGLMLSSIEGACYSSSEYLLCGVPVVSTRSFGGRDTWYDEYNSFICEDNQESVKEGVEFFKNNPRDANLIRERHIQLSKAQRNLFIDALHNVFERYQIKIDAVNYFKNNYFHKMISCIHEDKLKEIFYEL